MGCDPGVAYCHSSDGLGGWTQEAQLCVNDLDCDIPKWSKMYMCRKLWM